MHIPVLLKETLELLDVKQGDVVIDGTLGGGGHSEALCSRFGRTITLIGIDRDEDALTRSLPRLESAGCEPHLVHGNFREIDTLFARLPFAQADRVLFDFGVSSFQIDDSERGFSFQRDEPLLMTMKKNLTDDDVTAYDVVNTWSLQSLTDIIRGFGEEKYAYRIAKAIVASREVQPIKTTFELVDVIKKSVPMSYVHGKIHPATRTFQAIRIAVNGELDAIKEGLEGAWKILSPHGRIAVITFHSLEDRIAKHYFQKLVKESNAVLVNKKPLIPTEEEIKSNPRSRSSKLRVIQKL
ncbi:MAG: rRNA (cytosine1402-N4)-methyltransferase [Patescibacteria group bacterium]|nr:rRNA (cytosine1402-N4)-methyltransferase [Patescibacteria group bacterium]